MRTFPPQYVTLLDGPEEQIPHLVNLITHDQLSNPGTSKVMIFLQTTKQTQLFSSLIRELKMRSLPAGHKSYIYEIHSKKNQTQRDAASNAFRHDTSGAAILVTSDVSARGIDYPGVTRVIQVGVPAGREQYIHRIGRTGRAGMGGRGDFILLPWERNFLRRTLSDVPVRQLPADELKKEALALAVKHDEDPRGFFGAASAKTLTQNSLRDRDRDRRPRSVPVTSFQSPVEPSIEAVQDEIRSLLEKVDPEAIAETHMSLMGFYAGRVEDLQVPRGEIVAGLNSWTTDGLGLPTAPHVSEAMLARIGMGTSAPRQRRNSSSSSSSSSRGNFGLKTRSSYGMSRPQSPVEREWDDRRGNRSNDRRGKRDEPEMRWNRRRRTHDTDTL